MSTELREALANKERAAFEAWAKDYGRIMLDTEPWNWLGGWRYKNVYTQEAFVGWLARAALAAPQPAQAAPAAQPEQEAAKAEPVAWQYAASFWGTKESIPPSLRHLATPLYAHPAAQGAEPGAPSELEKLLDAYVAAHCDWFATGHASAQAYAALARSNLLDAMLSAAPPAPTPSASLREAILALPLPEPHAWQHEDWSSSFISNRTKVENKPSGKWPSYYTHDLYTADQMRALLQRAADLAGAQREGE